MGRGYEPPGMLTLADVLGRLRCGKSTLYRLIAQGKFPAATQVDVGTRWWEDEVFNYLIEQKRNGKKKPPQKSAE